MFSENANMFTNRPNDAKYSVEILGESNMKKSFDDVKRDEVLKRMLQTPHKPHKLGKKVAKKKKPTKAVNKSTK
jgi:hypothetical protein